MKPDNLLIVGAGFSANAGLPLASEFTAKLLNLKGLRLSGPSTQQIKFLRAFVDDVFGEGAERAADEWPELEDLFTIIDLSANTGHHLGPNYSASELRIVRRAMLVRMIRMLSQSYRSRRKNPNAQWRSLEDFFERFNADDSAVLNMNWDVVFESGIFRAQEIDNIDYGCNAEGRKFARNGSLSKRKWTSGTLSLLKPHGSVNWLYCDACRATFWVPPSDTEKVAQTLFQKRDWAAVLRQSGEDTPTVRSPSCPLCGGQSLGTRFATFSYRKALDFPMHAASWRTAEIYLKSAVNWVFVGYSMPAADFEFKHLLKRVQLAEKIRPEITLITAGEGAEPTIGRFNKFFGNVSGERFFFRNGLDNEAAEHLKNIGVLRPR